MQRGLPSALICHDGITGGVAADVGRGRVPRTGGGRATAAGRAALAENTAHLRTLTGVLAAVVAERRGSLTSGQLTVRIPTNRIPVVTPKEGCPSPRNFE